MSRPTTLDEILRYRAEHIERFGCPPYAIALTPGEKKRLWESVSWRGSSHRVSADTIERVYGIPVATLPCPDCGAMRRDDE